MLQCVEPGPILIDKCLHLGPRPSVSPMKFPQNSALEVLALIALNKRFAIDWPVFPKLAIGSLNFWPRPLFLLSIALSLLTRQVDHESLISFTIYPQRISRSIRLPDSPMTPSPSAPRSFFSKSPSLRRAFDHTTILFRAAAHHITIHTQRPPQTYNHQRSKPAKVNQHEGLHHHLLHHPGRCLRPGRSSPSRHARRRSRQPLVFAPRPRVLEAQARC